MTRPTPIQRKGSIPNTRWPSLISFGKGGGCSTESQTSLSCCTSQRDLVSWSCSRWIHRKYPWLRPAHRGGLSDRVLPPLPTVLIPEENSGPSFFTYWTSGMIYGTLILTPPASLLLQNLWLRPSERRPSSFYRWDKSSDCPVFCIFKVLLGPSLSHPYRLLKLCWNLLISPSPLHGTVISLKSQEFKASLCSEW